MRGHILSGWLAACLLAMALCEAKQFRRSDWILPAGFNIELYSGPHGSVPSARSLSLSGNSRPNGPWITYVSSHSFDPSKKRDIYAMIDLNGRGEADYVQLLVNDLSSMPNGIAWNGGSLFIAALDPYKWCRLYRLDNVDSYALGRKAAKLSDLVLLRNDLPIDFWHGWKFIRFGPDGNLYIPIGANCNACRLDGSPPNNGTINGQFIYNTSISVDTKFVSAPYRKTPSSPVFRFGSIYRISRDGKRIALVATGVRNTVGFDFHPVTKRLYFTDNGRDDWDPKNPATTNNRPDCELNVATKEGQDFGFPWCHTGPTGGNVNARPYLRLPGVGPQLADPDLNVGEKAMKCNGANLPFRPAIQAMGPHTAPLGMRFYRWKAGANFPAEYDNSILIAQHGSWNRERPIGARVMRVVLNPRDPTKVVSFTPFLSGGVPGDKGLATGPVPQVQPGANYNGRPVDLEQLPDGSMLVSDDVPGGGTVYRISYRPPNACRRPGVEEEVEDLTLLPGAVSNTPDGCAVNMGGSVGRYRRCVQAGLPPRSGRIFQLATSLAIVGGKLVLRGALVLPNYACTNSASGWVGFGLPRQQGEDEMIGAKVFITRPSRGIPTGAFSVDYLLASTAVNFFQNPTTGFLASRDSFSAYQAGGALVTRFEILLPYAHQRAAARAGKIPMPARPPGEDVEDGDPRRVSFLLALGDVVAGNMQKHWLTSRLLIPFSLSDINARVPLRLPVLNRGARFAVAPPPSPPPPSPLAAQTRPPPPASLPPPPAAACQPGSECCGPDGIKYQACTTDSSAGMPYTQYYTVSGTTLRVAIKATTNGWIAWSYHPSNFGGMIGADAFFARPCASCATGVATPSFNLASTIVSFFSTSNIAYTPISSGTSSGAIWASFSLPWPGSGSSIRINYGGGPDFGGTGANGMSKHGTTPPSACVSKQGGTASTPFSC